MSDRIAELEAKRAAKLAERSAARDAQYAIDLEARIELEELHGTLVAVTAKVHTEGSPTFALVRAPSPVEYKRFVDMVGKASKSGNTSAQRTAAEMMARACWVYPEGDEAQSAMLESYSGLLTTMANTVAALAQGESEEQGKD
jgi:hypothetical protein